MHGREVVLPSDVAMVVDPINLVNNGPTYTEDYADRMQKVAAETRKEAKISHSSVPSKLLRRKWSGRTSTRRENIRIQTR